MDWFYSKNNQSAGPVDESVLRRMLATGELERTALVWREGMTGWAAAEAVPGLFSPTAAATASPTTTASSTAIQAPAEDLVTCAITGKQFPRGQMIKIGNDYVSAEAKSIYLQRVREGLAGSSSTLVYAGFWIRFAAKFVDGILLQIVSFIILFAAASLFKYSIFSTEPPHIGFSLVTNLLPLLFALTYNTWFIGKFGATLGKMAFKIKVVRPDGSSISYGRAAARYLAEILSGIILGIGYIMAAFDEEKRALHDRICDTRVIRL